jgi:cytochrome c biogenesis factor
MERYTPDIVPAMRAARQQHGEWHFGAINAIHVPVALLSMALIALGVMAAARRGRFGDLDRLALTVCLALLANAAICGGLSNPHDRYGARMAWVATFAAILLAPRRITRAADDKIAVPAQA